MGRRRRRNNDCETRHHTRRRPGHLQAMRELAMRKWGYLLSTLVAMAIASPVAAADKPVLGLVMSFSGWFQPIDADTIAGAKLAVDDINAAGGVLGQPVEIVQFDNKSDPPLGAD